MDLSDSDQDFNPLEYSEENISPEYFEFEFKDILEPPPKTKPKLQVNIHKFPYRFKYITEKPREYLLGELFRSNNFRPRIQTQFDKIKEYMDLPDNRRLLESLPNSQTRVLDTLLYCAINNWGANLIGYVPFSISILNLNLLMNLFNFLVNTKSDTGNRLRCMRRFFVFCPDLIKKKNNQSAKLIARPKFQPKIINRFSHMTDLVNRRNNLVY